MSVCIDDGIHRKPPLLLPVRPSVRPTNQCEQCLNNVLLIRPFRGVSDERETPLLLID